MKALKALVIVLGLLIVAGVVLLIYGVSSRLGPRPAPAASAGSGTTTAFGTVAVPLPGGAQVVQVLSAGERLVVRIATPDSTELVVLDPARGEIAGRFSLAAPTLAAR
ncbi:MAG: hypothetical protein RLZZ501_370 [Pseudomonadota bacterium]|jgi:hypothetical protein